MEGSSFVLDLLRRSKKEKRKRPPFLVRVFFHQTETTQRIIKMTQKVRLLSHLRLTYGALENLEGN